MKLIIEIPEDLYKGIEIRDGALETEYVCDELMKAVDNATPLEKHDEEVIKETVASIWGKPPCDDAISREAVIKLVKKGEYDITGKTDNEMFLEEVNKLPNVQTKQDKGEE